MIIIFLLALLATSNVYSAQVDYKDRATIVCKDGVSFDQVEQTVRQLDPNMPEIVIDKHSGHDPVDGAQYDYSNHKIWVDPQVCLGCDSKSLQWILLHESGHSQYPKIWHYKIYGSVLTACGAIYFVKLPIKSMALKLAIKFLMSRPVARGLMWSIQNLEERRADAWANKCADKQAIQAQIELFARIEERRQKEWSQSDRSYYVPYSVGQYMIDPEHPLPLSRIKACQRALQKRFGDKQSN